MQAQSTQEKPAYQPLTLTIVLETEAEAKALATMVNYSPIVDAVKAAGLNLEPILDMMPKTMYNPKTWGDDVAIMSQVLGAHPALNIGNSAAEIIMEGTVEDQLDKMAEDFLGHFIGDETPSTQAEAPKDSVTCTATYIDYNGGTIEVSDGRQYKYELTGCGEAIVITTMDDMPVTEVPTSVYGTEELKAADIEVLEAVFTQIS